MCPRARDQHPPVAVAAIATPLEFELTPGTARRPSISAVCGVGRTVRESSRQETSMQQRHLSVCLSILLGAIFLFRGGASSERVLRSENIGMSQEQRRRTVGGYSDVTSEELSSAEFLELATFVMQEYARGSSSSQFITGLSAEEISGIQTQVLEGSRQVVAGLNYRLTIGITRNGACIGALKDVTIYKPLPAMHAPPRVTSWGKYLSCTDEAIASRIQESEETKALMVDRSFEEEREEAEPDA